MLGSIDCRVYGTKVQWQQGAMVKGCKGAVMQAGSDATAYRCNGAMVQGRTGAGATPKAMVQW